MLVCCLTIVNGAVFLLFIVAPSVCFGAIFSKFMLVGSLQDVSGECGCPDG